MNEREKNNFFLIEPFIAVILWGCFYPLAKMGLNEIPALSFLFLRMALASVVLFAVLFASERNLKFSFNIFNTNLLSASFAQFIFQALLIIGLSKTSASNGAILLSISPLWTAIWSLITKTEIFSKRHFIGLASGFGGVILLIGGLQQTFSLSGLIGDLLALAASIVWVWYSLALKPLIAEIGTLKANAWTLLISTILITPFSLLETAGLNWQNISIGGYFGLIYTSIIGLGVALMLWGKGIKLYGVNRTMIYLYLEPLIGVISAMFLLKETMSPLQMSGAVLILFSLWLSR